ncbi:DUF6318 family protein [uncultured Cellulomonas sp.]|uniref:DUF6318 family protein n=1 Tax=uncultured Cellulomonas sp. TaxID=189682 RepID=UPI0028E5F758|nr:DUF6318 family protein [uncultured Cellulomonas sp.]
MHPGDDTFQKRAITRAAVVAVAVLLWLTACTGSTPTTPTATGAGTESGVPTPTPSPTQTVDLTVPPVRPEAMATPSADGAAAAATYFTKLHAYAYATTDLAAWKAMSEPDCQFCTNVIDGVNAMVVADESDRTAEMIVSSAFGTEIDPGVSYSATLLVSQAASQRLDRDGNVIRTDEGGDFELYFALAWRDGWFVREVDTEQLNAGPTP